jgi:hypothetical protein
MIYSYRLIYYLIYTPKRKLSGANLLPQNSSSDNYRAKLTKNTQISKSQLRLPQLLADFSLSASPPSPAFFRLGVSLDFVSQPLSKGTSINYFVMIYEF